MKYTPVSPSRQFWLWARALCLGAVLLFVGSFLSARPAHAYAWMIRHDYTACSTCHADPSGGELLTKYGRVTSNLILSMDYGGDKKAEEEKAPKPGVFWGALDLPDALLLSGSYRNLYILRPAQKKPFTLVPVMQGDLYGRVRFGDVTLGGSLGVGKVSLGSVHVRPTQVTTNQGEQVNLISRTYYAGLNIGEEFVLRAGRLNLPFGVRMPEHTTWVREATRTDRESDQQTGLALAYTGDNFRAEVMAIAGNYQVRLEPNGQYAALSPDAVRERGYSFYLEGIGGPSFAAGVSSKVTYARLDRLTFEEKTVRQAHGLMMRWGPSEQFSVLAETDVLFRSNADAGYVAFTQADYEPIQGLHLMLTGEMLDEGMAVVEVGQEEQQASPGTGNPKFGGWLSVDWFFFKQMELRTDFILRQNETPTILGQFHMYL